MVLTVVLADAAQATHLHYALWALGFFLLGALLTWIGFGGSEDTLGMVGLVIAAFAGVIAIIQFAHGV